jgi:hypothetical protein
VSNEWIDDGCELAREDGALEIEVPVILKKDRKVVKENVQSGKGAAGDATSVRGRAGAEYLGLTKSGGELVCAYASKNAAVKLVCGCLLCGKSAISDGWAMPRVS